jgi:hypothetical protein
MGDTPTGETANQEPLKNNTESTTTPSQDNGNAEVERLRKEAEQAKIRANQLANELEAKKKAEDEARQKQLEEKEEFKTLYEQTQARLDEIQRTQEQQERQKELQAATETVLKEYDPKVIEVAKAAGLSLTDDSEAAQSVLKEKLDVIQKQVGTSTPRPGASNPRETTPAVTDKDELVQRADPWQGSTMAIESAKGNLRPQYEYIGKLKAIERMKEIAKGA